VWNLEIVVRIKMAIQIIRHKFDNYPTAIMEILWGSGKPTYDLDWGGEDLVCHSSHGIESSGV
jgi:hypothetical protein